MKKAWPVLRLRINHFATIISVNTCLMVALLGWLGNEYLILELEIQKHLKGYAAGTGILILTAIKEHVYSRRKMPHSSCLSPSHRRSTAMFIGGAIH